VKPLFTKITGDTMTYGLWDRIITKLVFKLGDYVENRHQCLWEVANNRRDEDLAPRNP